MRAASVSWEFVDASGNTVISGVLPAVDAPVGANTTCGKVTIDLSALPAPAKYTLVTRLSGSDVVNRWDFWTYPRHVETAAPSNVTVSSALDPATIATLEQGGRVLLLLPPERVAGSVKPGFTSICWNSPWTAAGEVDTMGLWCDPRHPVFAQFPTDRHTNWQWYDPMLRSKPMILDALPKDFRPLIQMIDDWNLNRRLGVLFEARVGRGIMNVSSIDLTTDIDTCPVARQLRASILHYLASDACRPPGTLTISELRSVMR